MPSLAFHKVKHVDPLPLNEIQRFMEQLRAFRRQSVAMGEKRGMRPDVALMIEFTILNGARQGEVRQAQWKEFDIERMIWEVPWQHLKMGYKHHTDLSRPITKEMLDILEEMQARRTDQSPGTLVFLSPRGRALNDTAPHSFFRFSFKWDGTPFDIHGFRSTMVDWCRKKKFTRELFDRQFDHVLGNRTGQSYGHEILLEERRQMIAEWCRFCSEPVPEPQRVKQTTSSILQKGEVNARS